MSAGSLKDFSSEIQITHAAKLQHSMNAIQCAVDIKTNQLPDVISAIHPWQVVQKIKKKGKR